MTADSPFAVKFNNGSAATYVIWNLSGATLPQVTFSDGHQVSNVAGYSLSVTTGLPPSDIGQFTETTGN